MYENFKEAKIIKYERVKDGSGNIVRATVSIQVFHVNGKGESGDYQLTMTELLDVQDNERALLPIVKREAIKIFNKIEESETVLSKVLSGTITREDLL